MNLYDVTAQVAALTAERDAALARVRELEAEAERLRAENAALRRANDVASEQWREGLSVVEDCRTLLRSVLGEGVTPELRQEILSALALNVHGETGQVERVRRVRRCGWCDSTGVYRDKDTDDVGPCPFCWEEG